MKPASLVAIVVFGLVSAAHLLRAGMGTELLIAGRSLPMGVSLCVAVVTGALAIGLWRERRVP